LEATELIKQVRKIEIRTRGLTNHIFAGQYHSAFKGRGIAFSEVREYQYGDDIRNIDWNVTARFNHPYVKIFEEERELTVILLVDVSGSGLFGTQQRFKRTRIAEIAAVLAFSAIQNNDKVGAILFSNKPEKFIPPKKGRQHILRIVRELIEFTPENKTTDIGEALRYMTNVIKKRSIAFLISDFLDMDASDSPSFHEPLRIAARKHDLIAIRVFDRLETELPKAGLLSLRDAETGKQQWIDSSDASVRKAYHDWWTGFDASLDDLLKRNGVDKVSINTGQDYVIPLMHFFKQR